MFKLLNSIIILFAVILAVAIKDDCSEKSCFIVSEKIETCDLCSHCNFQNLVAPTISIYFHPLMIRSVKNFTYLVLSESNYTTTIFRPPIALNS